MKREIDGRLIGKRSERGSCLGKVKELNDISAERGAAVDPKIRITKKI